MKAAIWPCTYPFDTTRGFNSVLREQGAIFLLY